MLIVHFNNYQRAAFFTATNKTIGDVYSAIADVDAYFGLKTENELLKEHNVELISEVTELRARIKDMQAREALLNDTIANSVGAGYSFYTANVVNNPLNSINNFMVIDKGTNDGVEQEMGVFCSTGIVGIVYLAPSSPTIRQLVLLLLLRSGNTKA